MPPKKAYCRPGLLTHCSYPWLIIFSMSGGKGIQLIEEYPVIDVVCAVTGKGHANKSIGAVDRTISPRPFKFINLTGRLIQPRKACG